MIELSTQSEQRIVATQIITIALVMGVVVFGLVSVLAVGALSEPPDGQFLSVFALVFTGINFVLHLILPNRIADWGSNQEANPNADANDLLGIFQTKTIIGLALLEGAAFFNLIACIVEHNWWSLAIVGALVFWMLAMFPTKTRVLQWIETKQMTSTE